MLAAMVRANAAHRRRVARKADIAGRAGAAEGSRRMALDRRIHAGSVFLRQGPVRDVSAADLARAAERDVQAYCRQGLGAVIAKLAADLPVRLSTPATRINWGGRRRRGRDRAGHDRRPRRHRHGVDQCAGRRQDAGSRPTCRSASSTPIERLKLGSYDHVDARAARQSARAAHRRAGVREIDRTAHRRAARQHVGQHAVHASMSAAASGASSPPRAPRTMVAFALDWLDNLYGAGLKRAVGRSHATRLERRSRGCSARCRRPSPGGQFARAQR